jgi:tRNA (guanine-N7-)-methyltransferase
MKMPTKRLTSSFFLQRYRSFLIDGGLIQIKTDSHFLFTYTKYLLKENDLVPICLTEDLYSPLSAALLPPEVHSLLQIKTYYEEQWLQRNIPIKFLSFKLPHDKPLREPEVEIELDDYRSFARNKRSSLMKAK